jgi:hypothetical protein
MRLGGGGDRVAARLLRFKLPEPLDGSGARDASPPRASSRAATLVDVAERSMVRAVATAVEPLSRCVTPGTYTLSLRHSSNRPCTASVSLISSIHCL